MAEYFIQENLNQEDYDNDFYYLTENKDEINKDELNENIYQEDFQHGNQHMYSSNSPTQYSTHSTHSTYPTNHAIHSTTPVTPSKTSSVSPSKTSHSSNYFQKNWLYIFLLILVIALVFYYLIDKKYIKLPSFESKSTLLSPSPSSTLGSTFMSLH
jgi:hypothetical protein